MSVIISNLPSYSGTDADLRWFVMNNSGETETYKFSGYTSGLVNGTGVDSIKSADWLTPIYGQALSSGLGSVGLGSQAEATGGLSVAVGWNCVASQDVSIAIGASMNATALSAIGIGNSSNASGQYSIFLGAEGNASGTYSIGMGRFSTSSGDNTIAIGVSTTASGTDSIAIGNGASHDTGTDGIAIGKNASATSNRSTAIGGTATSGGAATALGWGCKANGLASVSLGYFNETPNQYALGVGSSHNVSADFSTAIGGNNYMVGGTYNITFGWDISLSSGSYNTMLGGKTNTFTSTGSYNNIFNGSGNTISGTTSGATMLSCSGRTALYDNTTHVENSHNFKTESFGVTNVGSVGGSINVDCSLGTLFYFTITANTTPNFINWKEGQRIQFYVDNSGSFTVPTATITGGGSVYAKSGSLNPTNNEITSYYGTIVNGNMFLDEHLNFQPV
jgi:hypothetical protein